MKFVMNRIAGSKPNKSKNKVKRALFIVVQKWRCFALIRQTVLLRFSSAFSRLEGTFRLSDEKYRPESVCFFIRGENFVLHRKALRYYLFVFNLA